MSVPRYRYSNLPRRAHPSRRWENVPGVTYPKEAAQQETLTDCGELNMREWVDSAEAGKMLRCSPAAARFACDKAEVHTLTICPTGQPRKKIYFKKDVERIVASRLPIMSVDEANGLMSAFEAMEELGVKHTSLYRFVKAKLLRKIAARVDYDDGRGFRAYTFYYPKEVFALKAQRAAEAEKGGAA